jgi:hypothetical protein
MHLLVETKFTSFRENVLGLPEPNARVAYPSLPVTARIGKDGETSMLVHASPCLPLSGVYSINLAYVGELHCGTIILCHIGPLGLETCSLLIQQSSRATIQTISMLMLGFN